MLKSCINLRDLTFKKDELLEQIRCNRDKHENDYVEAMGKYKALLVEKAKELLAQAEAASRTPALDSVSVSHPIDITKPVNYLDEYDAAICMLEMTTKQEIEIDPEVFSQLVMDEWSWKATFAASTLSYKER